MATSRRAPQRGAFLRRLPVLLAATALLPGCFTLHHTVGRGPQSPPPHVTAEETQWFAVWGLVPLGDGVDSAELAGPTRDYGVTTKFTLWDVVISAFTSLASFYRQTIIVEK